MDPADFIARLTPVTQDFQQVGVSSTAGLNAMDAARALAGLERGPYLLSIVMWAGDMSSVYHLENQLWFYVCGVATDEKWVVTVGAEMLRGLAKMAVAEVISPRLCSSCSGRGSVSPRGGAVRDCAACAGTGKAKISGRHRARLAEIDKNSWQRVWGPRYERYFIAQLNSWEAAAESHVRQKLNTLAE